MELLELAESLKNIMEKQGVNASVLAKKSGVSMASLSRILAGTVSPSFANILKIASALNVGIEEISQQNGNVISSVSTDIPTETIEPANEINFNVAATFLLQNTDKSPKEAAQLLESAARGTWVNCWTEDFVNPDLPQVEAIGARQIGTRKIEVDLIFPHDIIEANSITGLLSVLSAAVTSTGATMQDIRIPEVFLRSFKGPALGVRGTRDLMGKFGRPLLSATMRPMHGLSPKMYGRAVYEALKGGVDMTCDPTLLHSIPGNNWRERFKYVAEAVHSTGNENNEFKSHAANITAATVEDMLERAAWAKELELASVMVDSAAIGWSALQSMANWCRENDIILCAMGGRALAGGMMSEQLEGKLLRLVGCDVTSIGSPIRGSVGQRRLSIGTVNAMREQFLPTSPENGILYDQPFAGMESCLPAVGGGHNPWHFPRLIDALGDDMIIQCGGSVMGHPWGSMAGATANRVAVEALVQARGEGLTLNVDGRNVLQRATKYSAELKAALEFWEEGSFLFGVIPGDKKAEGRLEGTVEKEKPKIPMLHAVDEEEYETEFEGDHDDE